MQAKIVLRMDCAKRVKTMDSDGEKYEEDKEKSFEGTEEEAEDRNGGRGQIRRPRTGKSSLRQKERMQRRKERIEKY